MIKKISAIFISIASLFLFAVPVFAHVAVKPDTVGIAATQDFTAIVPNEENDPTIEVRLLIPDGVKEVMPYVKQGWTASVTKNGDEVTEIDWTGGAIPTGQKDQFSFSAQAPATETTLEWKAYQKYQDGTFVSWDQKVDPKMSDENREKMEKTGKGPSSETKVINDLSGSSNSTQNTNTTEKSTKNNNLPLYLSIFAIILSATSFLQSRKK